MDTKYTEFTYSNEGNILTKKTYNTSTARILLEIVNYTYNSDNDLVKITTNTIGKIELQKKELIYNSEGNIIKINRY